MAKVSHDINLAKNDHNTKNVNKWVRENTVRRFQSLTTDRLTIVDTGDTGMLPGMTKSIYTSNDRYSTMATTKQSTEYTVVTL